MVDAVLGRDFPVLVALGNHDVVSYERYIELFAARIARVPDLRCEGTPSILASCRFRGIALVTSAIGITDVGGHEAFVQAHLAKADAPWRVCAWHIPHRLMQVGGKKKGVGWGMYRACRQACAMIATGHAHNYARTHLMDDFATQHVVGGEGPLRLARGRTFAVVSGLGGMSIDRQSQKAPWFAAVHTRDQDAQPAALICAFGDGKPPRARCELREVGGGVADAFDMVSEVRYTPAMSDTLQIEDIAVGDGAEAVAGRSVDVHYTGYLTTGTKFDSSVDRGRPFSFVLGAGQVIAGWDQGVAGMKVGGKRKLTIPPHLGYGDRGAGGVIPPGATLVFDVELLGVR